jgi:uncharacterized membrane protein YkvA (DUF1232 family)
MIHHPPFEPVSKRKASAQPRSSPIRYISSTAIAPALPQYELEPLPGFPQTLFRFNQYDGAKLLTAFLLLLATLYFLLGFLGFLVDHTPYLQSLLPKSTLSPLPHSAWWQFWHVLEHSVKTVASYVDLTFRLFVFLCAYCLAWATFDPRNIEGYVMGFFNACLGFAYIFSPVDVVPDFIPVAGNLDDTVLGAGLVLLGVSSWYRNKLRDVRTKTVLELIDHGNSQKAMQLLLEDKGISVKETNF